MQLVKATDFNDFTEAFVSGVANIEEIAPGVVRVSYFIDKEDTYEGDRERKIVDSQIWSFAAAPRQPVSDAEGPQGNEATRGSRNWCRRPACTERSSCAVIAVAAQGGGIGLLGR